MHASTQPSVSLETTNLLFYIIFRIQNKLKQRVKKQTYHLRNPWYFSIIAVPDFQILAVQVTNTDGCVLECM